MQHICLRCQELKDIPDYRARDGWYLCRPCFNAARSKGAGQRTRTERVRAYEAKRARLRIADPAERPRIVARKRIQQKIQRGKIARGSCEVCGATPAEAHHDDYSKPLDVRWLCRPHHREHHRNLKAA